MGLDSDSAPIKTYRVHHQNIKQNSNSACLTTPLASRPPNWWQKSSVDNTSGSMRQKRKGRVMGKIKGFLKTQKILKYFTSEVCDKQHTIM